MAVLIDCWMNDSRNDEGLFISELNIALDS